jgi:hypothetical protein
MYKKSILTLRCSQFYTYILTEIKYKKVQKGKVFPVQAVEALRVARG